MGLWLERNYEEDFIRKAKGLFGQTVDKMRKECEVRKKYIFKLHLPNFCKHEMRKKKKLGCY